MRKYKLFGKIPVFDLIVITVLLVVAFVGYKVITSSKSGVAYTTSQSKEVVVTVKFSNVSSQIKSEPQTGENVVENTTNNHLGTVISYEKEPYVMYDFSNITGDLVTTTYDDRYNITVKIKTTAEVSDMATIVGGTKIGIGKSLSCSMPSLCANGTVINMEEVEK